MPEMVCSPPVYPIGNRVHIMPEMARSAPVYPIGNRVHIMFIVFSKMCQKWHPTYLSGAKNHTLTNKSTALCS